MPEGHAIRARRVSARTAVATLAVAPLVAALLQAPPADARPAAPATPTASSAPAVRTATSLAGRSVEAFDRKVKQRLRKRVVRTGLGKSASVRVLNPTVGSGVVAARPRKKRIPASNMKLVTAANALARLGADHRFPTVVTGRKGAGTKAVVIVGGGDPLLRQSDVRALADQAAAAVAARRATGRLPAKLNVWVDDSLFGSAGPAPGWRADYVGRYVSPVRALGTLGTTSADTSMAAAQVFAKHLRAAHGVKVKVRGRAEADRGVELARFAGHTVGEAVDAVLLHSNNQVAEVLFRQVALASGRKATWKGSRRAARDTLRSLKVPVKGLRLHDGSGLSRSNRLTARSTAILLRRADRRAALRPLVGSLPTSGRTGTLSGRFTAASTACARGRVVAKTGYLDDVIALSGYAHGVDGRTRVFSILVNHPPRRFSVATVQRKVDRLAATVTGCT